MLPRNPLFKLEISLIFLFQNHAVKSKADEMHSLWNLEELVGAEASSHNLQGPSVPHKFHLHFEN